MRTGEAVKKLGIDKGTFYNWAANDLIRPYLSPGALGEEGTSQRIINDQDLLVLNTIRYMRFDQKNEDWEEIAAFLASGQRIEQFPQGLIASDPRVVSVPHAQQAAELMVARAERDAAIERVEELQQRIQSLEGDKKELLQEVRELYKQVGKLEGVIEMLKERAEE
jgi:DNA-binding transcriptional MerR regulator